MNNKLIIKGIFCLFAASPPPWRSPTHIRTTRWQRSPARTRGPPTDAHATGHVLFGLTSSSCPWSVVLGVGQSFLSDSVVPATGSPTRRPTGRRWRPTTARGTSAAQDTMKAETSVSVSNCGNLWGNELGCIWKRIDVEMLRQGAAASPRYEKNDILPMHLGKAPIWHVESGYGQTSVFLGTRGRINVHGCDVGSGSSRKWSGSTGGKPLRKLFTLAGK